MKIKPLATLLLALAAPASFAAMPADGWRFDFTAKPAPGYTAVQAGAAYDPVRGYGHELDNSAAKGAGVNADKGANGATATFFSADVPEGNVAVTVTLGPGTHTIKSEVRRLMLENVVVPAGQTVTRTFVVNTRTPQIAAANSMKPGVVNLKAPRETVQEAWNWDRRLTLEIHGGVDKVDIKPVQVPTIFLLGDSTVSDQPGEPYASWGQMLTRFFKPGVAVANHAQSGETFRDSLARRRIDKIVSQVRPGDVVVLQFGHNDQKQIKAGSGGPFTTYKAELRQHVEMVRAAGGLPVVVSSMERRRFDADGKPESTLADYAAAARQSAGELGVPYIDLNATSKVLYGALGVEGSKPAFATKDGQIDNTHHSNYGAYLLAKAVASGLRDAKLPVASQIVDGFAFDAARPDPFEKFAVPASPRYTNERPLGDEANR
ncbi:rhamnogalacturonan acetylesterase [Pseudoduganella sp. SL102]|uniref:rhamnogalacturonan acetylesterase n=1 Tax=Pseudoduganella sp. SL102 TaxID=2995154 RepID=UPI00248C65BE|nr:rhamnogalacturonan acetylesterase [Pseudoduganella sp. SL102]WBS04189.1 rhamnogalacturonan acetylesterase [Pseudoduganella sp. SL102]